MVERGVWCGGGEDEQGDGARTGGGVMVWCDLDEACMLVFCVVC